MQRSIGKVLSNSVALPLSLLSAPSSFPRSCACCRRQALLGICVSQPAGERRGEPMAASVASGRLEQKVPGQSGCIGLGCSAAAFWSRVPGSEWKSGIAREARGKMLSACSSAYTPPCHIRDMTQTSISADHLLKPGVILLFQGGL